MFPHKSNYLPYFHVRPNVNHKKQVLTYNPDILRYDPATLAAKLMALREAGVPAATVRIIARDAPRSLSVAAKALGDRVSVLKEAFPSVPVARLLGEAPCLLLKKIDPVPKVCTR